MTSQEIQRESSEMSDSAPQSSKEMNGGEESDDTDGARLPAVTRSARLKQQRNWKWKWWCFTKGRVLQPISETAESPKDDPSKDSSSSDEENRQYQECTGEQTEEEREDNMNSTQQEQDATSIHDICIATEGIATTPKDQYSACYKLIEKFQEAVLDNAVRIIQAAFKRFTLRRRFLRWRKAATVIQRNVRKWLQKKHAPVHLEGKETVDSPTTVANNLTDEDEVCQSLSACFMFDDLDTTVEGDNVEVLRNRLGHDLENSTSELQQPDSWGHPPSPLQHLKLEEPDSVSLTDSGIDGCSVASVEAVLEDNSPESKAVIPSQHTSTEYLTLRASPIVDQVEGTQTSPQE